MRLLLTLAALALLAAPSTAEAKAALNVSLCDDHAANPGNNTLRKAVNDANADPDHDIIMVRRSCVFEFQAPIYIDTPMEVHCVASAPGCLILGADLTSSAPTYNVPLVWIRYSHGDVVFRNFTLDSGGWTYTGTADNNQDCISITTPFTTGPADGEILIANVTCRGHRDEGIQIWPTNGTPTANVPPVTIRDVLVYGGTEGHTKGNLHNYPILAGRDCNRVTIDRALMIGGVQRNPTVGNNCPTSITNSASINYSNHGIRATGGSNSLPTTVSALSYHCIPGVNSYRVSWKDFERFCVEFATLQPGSEIYMRDLLGPHGYDHLDDVKPLNQSQEPSLAYIVTSNPLTFEQPEAMPVWDVAPYLLATAGAACRDETTLDVIEEARRVWLGLPDQRGAIKTREDMVPHRRGASPSVDNSGAKPKESWFTDIDPDSIEGQTKWDRWLTDSLGRC